MPRVLAYVDRGTPVAVVRDVGRIDEMKHDADVIERVLGIADQPPYYKEVHTDIVDLEIHPWLTESPSPVRVERSHTSTVRNRRDRS